MQLYLKGLGWVPKIACLDEFPLLFFSLKLLLSEIGTSLINLLSLFYLFIFFLVFFSFFFKFYFIFKLYIIVLVLPNIFFRNRNHLDALVYGWKGYCHVRKPVWSWSCLRLTPEPCCTPSRLSCHLLCNGRDAQLFSCVRLFMTSWTLARQAPLSMGILQARLWEWVAMTSSKRSSQPTDQTQSPALQVDSLPSEPPGKPNGRGLGLNHQKFFSGSKRIEVYLWLDS